MEVPGVCAICGAHGIVKTCAICGKQVCRPHFDAAHGACTMCATRRPGSSTEPESEPANVPPGPEDAGGRYT